MRFKLGLVTGLGLGYVLGTRAGEERYEQIREQYTKLKKSPQAQQLSSEVDRVKEQVTSTVDQKTKEGVDSVTDASQERI